ncbi:ribosomal protein L1-like protein [Peziza echinospora]|nr:ribosomal protein L1-like protein [Peziza echinospora]
MPPRLIPTPRGQLLPLLLRPTGTSAIPCQHQIRNYAAAKAVVQKKNPQSGNTPRKKPQKTHFTQYDLRDAEQFSLTEAMRYLRAFEVGQNPTVTKYELHVKLNAQKNGPTIKNRVALPNPVKTDLRICVIAEGKFAEDAKKAGAALVGTDEVFELIRAGKIDFDQCIAHEPSYPKLQKARVAQILGPKGLMPSPKFGTVVQNPAAAIKDLVGKSDYRERLGVIRMAVGQLGFSEKELAKNIQAFMESVKKDVVAMQQRTDKGIVEVVLSTTHGPGMSLNGELKPSAPVKAKVEGKEAAPATATATA